MERKSKPERVLYVAWGLVEFLLGAFVNVGGEGMAVREKAYRVA